MYHPTYYPGYIKSEGEKVDSKMKAIVAILVACLVVMTGIFVFFSVINSPDTYSVSMTDALGRQVNITAKPQRIVSCTPETELLFALGAGDSVVGVTDYCDYPVEMVAKKYNPESNPNGTIRSVGGWFPPEIKDIINLTADLVVMRKYSDAPDPFVFQLEANNINALVLYGGDNFDEVYKNIGLLGTALKMEDQASNMVQGMKDQIALIHGIAAQSSVTPKVLFLITDPWGDWTVGNKTFINSIIAAAGGVNLFNDVTDQSWFMPEMKDILLRAPDVIIATSNSLAVTPEEYMSGLENSSEWQLVPAVANHKVFVVHGQGENIFVRQSVRLTDATEILAKILHPTEFGENLPHVIGDEYEGYITPHSTGSNLSNQSFSFEVAIRKRE
jgi:iron complex transport system substrate-binding protein